MKNIAILASGSGSNAEKIIQYFAESRYVNVAVVLSNKIDAGVHERAENFGVPSFTFSGADFKESTAILQKLSDYKIDFIVLAGFLSLISPALIDVFGNKIVNIHPALLPKFGGKGMYGRHVHEAVLAAKEPETGITIHYVDECYDEGAIIFQAKCTVLPADTVEDIEKKIHELEYKYYPKVIEDCILNTFVV